VVSKVEDFTQGSFQEVIDDSFVKPSDVKRVLFCTGKIYYDLLEKQQADQRKDVAIVRVEQLYPTPIEQLRAIKDKYKKATELIWVQEEPENMGAWPYICRRFYKSDFYLNAISRKESSSTATGYSKQHVAQQLYIIGKAFEDIAGPEVKKAVVKTTKKVVNID